MQVRALTILICLGLAADAAASDWPQWRGPARTGISSETGWKADFGSNPKRLWTANIGSGYSSMAVAGGRVYTMGSNNGRDVVSCLNAATGKVVWQYNYPSKGAGGGYDGPRATPVVDGAKVYTLSQDGQAFCFDTATGKPVWYVNFVQAIGARFPQWGFAGSPLIEGDLAIYNMGTTGTALNKNTGKIVWKSGSSPSGYSSPFPYTVNGKRAVLIFAAKGIVAVDPGSGSVLWEHGWSTSYDVNAADPVVAGTDVFISSNYGVGCALLRTGGGRPTVVWQNRDMKNHFNSSVLVNGVLYGNDEGRLRAMDLRTGRSLGEMRGMDKGGLIAADGKLIIVTGRGELVIAEATPRLTELSRAQILDGECWTHPVLANGLLYARNYQGTLVCLDLRK
jgi:outer membrane protein assembly factor BamB